MTRQSQHRNSSGDSLSIPHVILDAGPAVHQRAGLSRYATQLALHLQTIDQPKLRYTLFYNRHSQCQLPPTLVTQPHFSLPMGQYIWRLSVLASQLSRLPYLPLLHAARQQSSHNNTVLYHATEHLLPRLPVPTILTVHDLIFERFPQHHTSLNRRFLQLALPRFVQAATAIIAVSRHTAQDLIELYRVPPAKVHVIYEGIDEHFQPATLDMQAQVQSRYRLIKPYLLMVGTLEPRKNHATALRAMARLKAAGLPHRLVIAGGEGWLFDGIKQLVEELQISDRVTFTGYVPVEELPALYSGAEGFLFPSLYEGFGFPVLEAMACGAPVICSDVSSLPEVAGKHAIFVAPTDDAAIAAAVGIVHRESNPERRQAAIEHARSYRWANCAKQTAQLYAATATSTL
jgi:glycosyltransferase involved in cell wall biosynthesis